MPKKILVIENSNTRPILTLEASNYELLEARSASEGLNQALDQKPQLLLIDTELPDQSGFELCKRMRSYSELKKIPIIIFSTENKLKNMVTAYEMGADYYIVKGDGGDRVLTLLIETIFTRLSRRSPQTIGMSNNDDILDIYVSTTRLNRLSPRSLRKKNSAANFPAWRRMVWP